MPVDLFQPSAEDDVGNLLIRLASLGVLQGKNKEEDFVYLQSPGRKKLKNAKAKKEERDNVLRHQHQLKHRDSSSGAKRD